MHKRNFIIRPYFVLTAMLLGCFSTGFIFFQRQRSLIERSKPDESRFTPVVLVQDLDEPMAFEVLNDESVLIVERKGTLRKYDPVSNTARLLATIPVNTKYTSAEGVTREAEEGLMGLSLDPSFDQNHWVYLYYAHPTEKKHVLTRWTIKEDQLEAGSEKVMLEVQTQREVCCHTGGGMTWDRAGNLYLTVGNNTGNQQAAQTDERPGRSSWDDQGHAGNTNDLRGKILRIHPERDGSYTIPEGNLFPKGTPKTRPEIYTMGHRNPWRISVDSQTGYVYWGEVGPDASEDSEVGPQGYDELNQARKPGNFGWPWFVANNQAFPVFDYGTNKLLAEKDPNHLVNSSPNNTGLTDLPPVSPAFIYYPYGISKEFPLVGSGSRSATGGPIFHRTDFKRAKRAWPSYYEGKWLATDFSRGWILAITMDQDGNFKSMEHVLPNYHPVEPIDMKFGPNGDLYTLEYGSIWFRKSDNSRLVRIEYNGGNRKPQVVASASRRGGSVPVKLMLSSEGSKDMDGDALLYSWKITGKDGYEKTIRAANPALTLEKPGVYTATLTVSDPKGLSNSQSVKIVAGNEPPSVDINVTNNRTFFLPNQPIQYSVSLTDKEDGSLTSGQIKPDQVAFSIDYAPEGFDAAELIQGQRSVDASTQYAVAQTYMNKSDCKVCHQVATKSVGPAFHDIADKYKSDGPAVDKLIKKIQKGGVGVWGDVAMPAHPAITEQEASAIVNYILHTKEKTLSTLPLQGTFHPKLPADDKGRGTFVLRAAYTDRGNKTVPSQTTVSQIVLRNPVLSPADAEIVKNTEIKAQRMKNGLALIPRSNGYIGFKKIDLTGIKQVELMASAPQQEAQIGGIIEIRVDSPTGELIGQTRVETSKRVGLSSANTIQNAGGATATTASPPGSAGTSLSQRVVLKAISGLHDVYLIFKNEQAKPDDPLLSLFTIRFNTIVR